MPTLVKCLTYDEGISAILNGAEQKTDFRVNASPQEVLQQTINSYYLESYLETTPWMTLVKKGRDYLDISEINSSQRLHGNLNDFLSCPDFSSAKRQHELTPEEKTKLIESILYTLSLENTIGLLVSRSPNHDIAYTHVLNSLGHDITPQEVSEMITAQAIKRHEEITADQMRRARNMSSIS